jgi:transposase-like protein
MNHSVVSQQLPTGKSAIRHFETIRWGQKPKCAYCQSKNLWERRIDQRFQCKNCNNTFSVKKPRKKKVTKKGNLEIKKTNSKVVVPF